MSPITTNNAKPYFFLNEMNKKDLLAMYSTAFWCLIVVYWLVWLYCVTAVTYTPFIERSEGWSLRSVGVLDQSQQECGFFSPKFKSTANFSAPAQEGDLFFLSGRSARKRGSEWGGPLVGCRLKFSYFVGSRLKFSIFVGCRLISVNK